VKPSLRHLLAQGLLVLLVTCAEGDIPLNQFSSAASRVNAAECFVNCCDCSRDVSNFEPFTSRPVSFQPCDLEAFCLGVSSGRRSIKPDYVPTRNVAKGFHAPDFYDDGAVTS
jgi:hypothetical protein